nr:reverse transcriptase domain-containing protein [Tanacetum cinerariifolium]
MIKEEKLSPKIRIEAKNQEKEALEVVTRRANPKTLIRPIFSSKFQIGDRVMLKVSPCKGVIQFGKQGKLNPRMISSPNYPTSDIEDAFSFNSHNYTSASPDYLPASPNASQKEINICGISICNANHDSSCHQIKSVFSSSNCAEENKVTFATGTPTVDALSWWNAYAQPIGIEQANKTTRTELKRLLTNKYCPQNEVKKMEDEFYNLIVKGNDLKTYVRRFQELVVLGPNMVLNTEKLMKVFIGELPQSIEGSITASKPQTLEEAINIS